MREATQDEQNRIDEIVKGPDNQILDTLIANPQKWFHICLNEAPGNALPDQMDALVKAGETAGHKIETVEIRGHLDGGFFARRV